jgi:multidrug efflux pump subunit AcrB
MFVALLDGFFSYFNLGREEDPAFTIKTMVIQTRWPGATQDETLCKSPTASRKSSKSSTPSIT